MTSTQRSELTATIVEAVKAGLCVVPPEQDGSKKPIGTWKEFQEAPPSVEQLGAWYTDGQLTGIGLVCGAVSGNVEMLESEARDTFDRFTEAAHASGLGDLWSRITSGYLESTPGGGVHTLYHCPVIGGNTKLASRPKRPGEMKHPHDNIQVLIETRGEGGYTIIAPSNGNVHPSGGCYTRERGSLATIATITPEEREALFELARSFDEMAKPEPSPTVTRPPASNSPGWTVLPGDDFNALGDWEHDILTPAGWTFAFTHGDRRHYRRPGKSGGTSGNIKNDQFYVFTTSTALDADKAYSKFGAFARLFHGGDYRAAFRALADRGFGQRAPDTTPLNGDDGSGDMTGDPATARDLPERKLTDLGNGERLVDHFGERLRYVEVWKSWLIYEGGHWALDEKGRVVQAAKHVVRRIHHEADRFKEDDQADKRKSIFMHAIRSESRGRVDAMVALAATEHQIAAMPDEFDRDPWLLNCKNGTIDLRDGLLRAHDRGDLITKICPVAYEPEASAPTWDAFLARILPDASTRAFVQRLAGYSLTGVTYEQILPILWGAGANGKSTFVNALRDLLGPDYAGMAPRGMLEPRRAETVPDDLAALRGIRLLAAVEFDEGHRLAEALIKQLTGGEAVRARKLYGSWFEFQPTFKMWLSTNHKPTVRGSDHAIWRRLRLIPFTETIPEAERDMRLPEKLRAELPGILAWAVRGALDWQRDGLGLPASVQDATAAYRTEQDVLGAFLTDRCELAGQVKAGTLFKAYKTWCDDSGEHALSQTAFGTRLAERPDIDKVRLGTGVHYIGIQLTENG